METDKALELIKAERGSHSHRGFNAEHDKEHGVDHLLIWATHYNALALNENKKKNLIKAASLLVAAIEQLDE